MTCTVSSRGEDPTLASVEVDVIGFNAAVEACRYSTAS